MTAPITSADVGNFLLDKNGDVWKVVGYTDQPTAIVERLRDQHRDQQGVGCRIMEEHGFRRLAPEEISG